MSDSQFVDLFMRLNPNLKVVIQRSRPSNLEDGYRYIALKKGETGMDYFDKGIFHFQETTRGLRKFVFTKKIDGQLIEEISLVGNSLCREFYNEQGEKKCTFCYKKSSNCIQEEIFDKHDKLKERSIYRANSQNEIDFPAVYFRGSLRHHHPIYLLKEYQISFGDNCTRSVYDDKGHLVQQEIHKNGKIVRIRQNQSLFERLLRRPQAQISYAEDSLGNCRAATIRNIKRAQRRVSHSEFLQIRQDNIAFYHSKFSRCKS